MLAWAKSVGSMNQPRFPTPSSLCTCVALSLALVLVASVPFGHALEIHHIFSEIDHDGHEHAEYDLCTWVEHHVGGSYVQDSYRSCPSTDLIDLLSPPRDQWVYSVSRRVGQSRAPPLS